MEKVRGTKSFLNRRSRWLAAAGMSVLFTLALSESSPLSVDRWRKPRLAEGITRVPFARPYPHRARL